jgi:hypothetical protein
MKSQRVFISSLPGFGAESALSVRKTGYSSILVRSGAVAEVTAALRTQSQDNFDPTDYCDGLRRCCAKRFLDCCIAYRRDCA